MRITHVASVIFSQFLSFLLSTKGGRGGGHMYYLANVPRGAHFLVKDPTPTHPPPDICTFG